MEYILFGTIVLGAGLYVLYKLGYKAGFADGRAKKREELLHGFVHILALEGSKVVEHEDGSATVTFTVPPDVESA
jgi:hypothetical protein